jgi:acyl-lipid omega-6 desaturase (Delta-12 desaturase)
MTAAAPWGSPVSPGPGVAGRTGAELKRALRPFACEDPARTWRLLGLTLLALVACESAAALLPLPFGLVCSVAAGLVELRLLIFFHDAMHGSIFRGSPAGRALMQVVGGLMMISPSVWRETHERHHGTNGRTQHAGAGGFPVLTRDEWKRSTRAARLVYRATRHPLAIACGYLTLFVVGMGLLPLVRAPRKHASVLLVLLAHAALIGAVSASLGLGFALRLVVLPIFVALGVGSYILYAHHNVPGVVYLADGERDHERAAFRGSSHFRMSALMGWMTGNLGVHHVHHLNSRVPFYRLSEAAAAVPELAQAPTTSWHPRDMVANLRLAVWDPERDRMLTYAEVEAE